MERVEAHENREVLYLKKVVKVPKIFGREDAKVLKTFGLKTL